MDFSGKKLMPSNSAMNSLGVIVQYLANLVYVFQDGVCVCSGEEVNLTLRPLLFNRFDNRKGKQCIANAISSNK